MKVESSSQSEEEDVNESQSTRKNKACRKKTSFAAKFNSRLRMNVNLLVQKTQQRERYMNDQESRESSVKLVYFFFLCLFLSLLASSPFYHRETRQKVPQQTLAWVTKVTSSFSQWLQERQEVYNTILMGFLEATHYCDNDHQKWDQQEEEEDAMKHKRHSQDMKWNSIHLSKTMEMRKED